MKLQTSTRNIPYTRAVVSRDFVKVYGGARVINRGMRFEICSTIPRAPVSNIFGYNGLTRCINIPVFGGKAINSTSAARRAARGGSRLNFELRHSTLSSSHGGSH